MFASQSAPTAEAAPGRHTTGRRRARLLVATAISLITCVGLASTGLAGTASAAALPAVSYGTMTYCTTTTDSTYGSGPLDALLGPISTTTTETLEATPPNALAWYPGTAVVVWGAAISYQRVDGTYPFGSYQGMLTAAGTASVVAGRIQSIWWSNQPPTSNPLHFVRTVTPNESYRVWGITEWLNNAGQVIASSSGYVPNYNC